jgi:hypothetical protein
MGVFLLDTLMLATLRVAASNSIKMKTKISINLGQL